MYHFNYLLSNLVYSTMSHYGYLPHEYTYALFLADHYDLYPWDSMIHNNNPYRLYNIRIFLIRNG